MLRQLDTTVNLSMTIAYNNIENCSQNSIYLENAAKNIDATNNWWGTTDVQAINFTIRDSKYEFDIGTVYFVPFLSEPNPETMPTSNPPDQPTTQNYKIPEFPSIVILPLFLTATFVALIVRKRFAKKLIR